MKRRFPLIIGIILGVVAIILTNQHIQQERRRVIHETRQELVQVQKDLVSVVIAKTEIPAGGTIEVRDLDMQLVHISGLQPNAARSLERIIGMMTAVPISKGEQILLSKLISTERATSLAVATPVGKRAITIPVDTISSVGGMIKPGDYVDVMGIVDIPITQEGKQVAQTAILPLFQNVLVLAVGLQFAGTPPLAKREVPKESAPIITLAVSPQEANLIAFVSEQGKIRFTLRSPADSRIQPITPASWDTLFQYLYPEMGKKGEEPLPPDVPKEKKREIEIYRGLQRETLPLEK